MSPSSTHGVAATRTSVATVGTARRARWAVRVRVSPKRTASVVLPVTESLGDVAQVVGHQDRAGVAADGDRRDDADPVDALGLDENSVPRTATRPKNTNTATSPNPA